MSISRCLSSSEIFHAIDLGGVGIDDGDRRIHGLIEIIRTPISAQGRIEHVAEPVDDHGLADLRQYAIVDLGVVVGVAAEPGQRARGHQDDAPANLFHRRDLLLVGCHHVVDGLGALDREMIGTRARKHQWSGFDVRYPVSRALRSERQIQSSTGINVFQWSFNSNIRKSARREGMRMLELNHWRVARFRSTHRTRDQFQRGRPVQPHAALGGVHRFGYAEAEIPDVLAKRNRPVPIDRSREPGIDIGARVGNHMRRGEGDAVECSFQLRRKRPRRREAIGLDAAVGCRQRQLMRRHRQHRLVHGRGLPKSARSAPSPRSSRGEGWGEGLSPRKRCK